MESKTTSYNNTKAEIENLVSQRNAFLSAAAKLDAAIKLLQGNPEKPIDWKNKALGCIRKYPYPLRTIDVLNCLFINEREKLSEASKRRNYVAALSIALNNLCDNEILGRMQIQSTKGFFYGLREQFDENGILLDDVNEKLQNALYKSERSVFRLSEKKPLLHEHELD